MTHESKGHFAGKHPKGIKIEDNLRQVIYDKARDNAISCAAAHDIARKLNISPSMVGQAIDLLEYKIEKCQLGLFGYSPKKNIVQAASSVSGELETQIRSRLQNGRLACIDAWRLARENGISKLEICSACEALSFKITPCQLGAF